MSEPRPRSELVWTGSLAAELALALAGFWALLGFRFSPETYQAGPTARGTVELAWFSLAVAATIVALAWLRRHANASRRWALAGLPLALVSLFMLIRWMAGLELKCYDAVLFSAASGWVLALAHASRKAAGPTGPETELAAAAHRAATPSMALLWTFGLVLGGYYFWQQTGYWRNLALGYADVGIIARVMHNTIHEPGELFLRAGPDAPLFYDHFQPGILPLVPLWAVWPDLRLVILFQIVATLGSAVPLYWIGRKMFSDKRCAVLLALAWLVYPSTSQFIYNASYGFRWGSFCIPLYFVALACWLHGRTGWAIAAAAWALLIKEEAAIVLGMFGLYLAYSVGNRGQASRLRRLPSGIFCSCHRW